MTLSDVNEAYLRSFTRELRSRGRAAKTVQSYNEAARLLINFLGIEDVSETSPAQVQSFTEDQLGRHSHSTAAVRFRSLQQFFNWLVREDIIERSPMVKLKAPSVPVNPVPVLSDDYIMRLYKACEGKEFSERRDLAMIRLFIDTGVRVGEMAGMTLPDVDLQVDRIEVLGKGSRRRFVAFGPKSGTVLERYLRVRSKHPVAKHSDRLWLGARGKPMTTSGIYQMLERRSKEAGIPRVHPHMLRHTAAHAWMANGGQEGDAMRLFGWRSSEMPKRYGASAADERAQEAHRRMALGDRL